MFGPCRLSRMLIVACSRAWLRRTALTTRFSIYASVSEYITRRPPHSAASQPTALISAPSGAAGRCPLTDTNTSREGPGLPRDSPEKEVTARNLPSGDQLSGWSNPLSGGGRNRGWPASRGTTATLPGSPPLGNWPIATLLPSGCQTGLSRSPGVRPAGEGSAETPLLLMSAT